MISARETLDLRSRDIIRDEILPWQSLVQERSRDRRESGPCRTRSIIEHP